jgi:hypothetical protein
MTLNAASGFFTSLTVLFSASFRIQRAFAVQSRIEFGEVEPHV